MFSVFKQIFRSPLRIFLTIFLTLILFLVLVMYPNKALFSFVFHQFGFFSGESLSFLGGYIVHLPQILIPKDFFLPLVTSFLFVVNMVIFVYFFKRQKALLSASHKSLSVVGMFLGLFGVGCLSCGTLLLAPLVTALGLGGLLRFGSGITILGLGLLLISSMMMLRKMSQPLVC